MNQTVPLLDLNSQYASIREEIDEAIRGVLESGTFINGPNVEAFEREMAEYVGVENAVGVASGTDALLLTLRAMGIGEGDEVIVPAFTFFATCSAVMLAGARPVLVDIEPATYCIDPVGLEQSITSRTRAVIPVHLFGHPADLDPICNVAASNGLQVIEDNAQAIGARYKERVTGSIGDTGCLSFYPAKNLGAYGDGGMVLTSDDALVSGLRMLRSHGWTRKYYSERLGYNSRLDELQAAVLRVKLRHIDRWNDRRRGHAESYSALLADLPLRTPLECEYARSVYHLYVIEVEERVRVMADLDAAGIGNAVYYPYPLHLTPALESLGHGVGDFPVAEHAAGHCLTIPLYPEMTNQQTRLVVDVLRGAVALVA